VIAFYAEKLKQPIWLMGHSNGAISVAAFYEYNRGATTKANLSGLIFSFPRDGASLGEAVDIPVLVIRNARDTCGFDSTQGTQAMFDAVRKVNTARTAFHVIQSGAIQPDDPCHSGFHMEFEAGPEVATVIETFVFSAPQEGNAQR
jgi:hypothetical protein